MYIQSYVALPIDEFAARDFVQVAVAPQKTAEAASVLVSEARMLTMSLFWQAFVNYSVP